MQVMKIGTDAKGTRVSLATRLLYKGMKIDDQAGFHSLA